jgi:hypothetical protein
MIFVLEDGYIGRYLPSNRDVEVNLNPSNAANVIILNPIPPVPSAADGPTTIPPPQSEELNIDIDPDRIELEEIEPKVNANV